jgi:hypothetical protein
MSGQICCVRGCVSLANDPDDPFHCRIHRRMTCAERHEWSKEHGYLNPTLQPVTDRIEREKSDA